MKTHTRKQNLKNKFNKLYFFILIMCITCISNAQNEGWHLLPFVPSQTLWDIHCINEDTVIAVGDKGYIIRTTNGGSYWDSIYSTTNNTLSKVTFVNDAVGYICGENGTVLKTENSGLTWTNIGISTSLNLLSMSFINQDTGWIVGGNGYYPYYLYGDKGLLLKTCNGGENWDIDTNYISTISSVCFIDNDTGYIAINNDNSNLLLKTINNGLTYDTIQLNKDNQLYFDIRMIVFSDPKTGYCIVNLNNEGIYKSDDYGVTWNKLVEFYYPILNMEIIDSCNLYYNCWDNTTGSSNLMYPFVGINHCIDNTFNQRNYYFNGYNFISINYGFCVGKEDKNFIYKLGEYNAINKIEKKEYVKVFPNPCNDKSILISNSSLDLDALEINVYNLIGQKIKSQIQIQKNEIIIDLSKEKRGVYIVSIKDKNKIIENCKLIKL